MQFTKQKKIMVVFGTRPETTKLGPVVQELKKYPEWFDTRVIVTGQHKEQLQQAMDAFDMVPDANLEIMKDNQSLSYILAAGVKGLDQIMTKEKPDLVMIHGDTQTTVCGTLAALYNEIPVAHIEAGQRSFNKKSPFPEEVNRRIADVVADLHFSPTPLNRENLLREGIDPTHIYVTGQTAVDAAIAINRTNDKFREPRLNEVDFSMRVILATAHRRENYGAPMENMFKAMRRIVDDNPDVMLVYPVHLSPRVRDLAFPILGNHDRIMLLDPIEFPDMINIMSRSYLVMSDSGGLQEECPVFKKPLVLMRETTERPEGVEAGCTELCGTSEEAIYKQTHLLLNDKDTYYQMVEARNPFGDGRASERIVKYLAYHYGFLDKPMVEFKP